MVNSTDGGGVAVEVTVTAVVAPRSYRGELDRARLRQVGHQYATRAELASREVSPV
jgi:hypothetical protein